MYNGNVGNYQNTVNYTYTVTDMGTTNLVQTYTSVVGSTSTTYTYTYDSNGNITKIVYSNGKEIRYYYDDLNQLVREDNSLTNATYIYTYDNDGS